MLAKYTKKQKIIIGLALGIFIFRILTGFLGGGSTGESAIDKYVNVDLENLQVAENLEESGKALEVIFQELQLAIDNGEDVDVDSLETNVTSVLEKMQDKKSEIEKLTFEDDELEGINQFLIKAYDGLILGYQTMMEGIKNHDAEVIENGQQLLEEAGETIVEWQQLVNK